MFYSVITERCLSDLKHVLKCNIILVIWHVHAVNYLNKRNIMCFKYVTFKNNNKTVFTFTVAVMTM